MSTSVRKRQVLALLAEQGELTVEEACEHFGISPATARRDFVQIANEGKAEKTWGGLKQFADRAAGSGLTPTSWRFDKQREAKQAIARKAASFVKDGEVLFIDGGTTTFYLAEHLAERRVRIVTNSLLIAHEIDQRRKGQEGAEVFLTGGYLYPRSGLLVGPEAVASIRRYQASHAFLSVGALDAAGAWNNHDLVVEVERIMLTQADQVYLLADSSKFGRREMVQECSWEECSKLITEAKPAANAGIRDDKLVIAGA